MNITDNDSATLSIVKTLDSSESGSFCGMCTPTRSTLFPYTTLFRSSLSGTASSTAGVDYNATPTGSVTITAGNTSATITVAPIDDNIVEGTRSEEHTSELQSQTNVVC